MKIEEKFNKRGAALVEVATPIMHSGPQYAEGVCVTFGEAYEAGDRDLHLHMTPAEAMDFAIELLRVARRMSKDPTTNQERK